MVLRLLAFLRYLDVFRQLSRYQLACCCRYHDFVVLYVQYHSTISVQMVHARGFCRWIFPICPLHCSQLDNVRVLSEVRVVVFEK